MSDTPKLTDAVEGDSCPPSCCGSLVWELRGEEWHADPESGLTYTIMPWSSQWVCIVFRGTRYKRGGQIGPLDDSLESAKERCAEHYRQQEIPT